MNTSIDTRPRHSIRRVRLATVATSVYAQDAGPGDSAILEQVVVTAQKREEKLQDVPIQVNVFSEQKVATPASARRRTSSATCRT
jgi:outer membrane receptor protein involved in Fe transport